MGKDEKFLIFSQKIDLLSSHLENKDCVGLIWTETISLRQSKRLHKRETTTPFLFPRMEVNSCFGFVGVPL